jgi:cytochrome c peroxidase
LAKACFFDTRLSASGKFACATCHVPERNWTDNRIRGAAAADVDRNTPTLMNVRLGRWFGWAGGADSLWSQSIRPILDGTRAWCERAACRGRRAHATTSFRAAYRRVFGAPASLVDDEAVLVDVAKALACIPGDVPESRDTVRPVFAIRSHAAGDPAPSSIGSGAARPQDLRRQGELQHVPQRPELHGGEFHDNGFSAHAAQGRIDHGAWKA